MPSLASASRLTRHEIVSSFALALVPEESAELHSKSETGEPHRQATRQILPRPGNNNFGFFQVQRPNELCKTQLERGNDN